MKNRVPMSENTLFLSGVTFLGGFLDAYTYITRGGVFANNHTGNVAKFGIVLARGDLAAAWNCLLPILCCVFGAAFSETIKNKKTIQGDWRKAGLLVEAVFLFVVGLLPVSIPNQFVNAGVSFVAGYQLCLFRNCRWGGHNTTICTGNLRSVGQYLYAVIQRRTSETALRFVQYTLLVLSFVLGSFLGTPICSYFGARSAFWGMAMAAFLWGCMVLDEHQNK